MSYKVLFIIFVTIVCGLAFHTHQTLCVVPIIVNLLSIQFNWLALVGIFIGSMYFYKFMVPFLVSFGVGYGKIEYKNQNYLYVSDIKSNHHKIPNNLKLKYNERDYTLKDGDNIKFSCTYFSSGSGKINKIYKINDGQLSLIQKTRIDIDQFLENSKFYPFMKSIILGDNSELSDFPELKNSGFWHLVAISGLHMNILILYLYWILRKLFAISFRINYYGNPQLFASVLSIIFGLCYLHLILYPVSAVRALIMTSCTMLFSKSLNNKKVLLLTAFGFIITDPNVIFNMSFQLSFLCTWLLINKFSLLFINCAILPILGQFNLVALLSNFIVLPLFSIVLLGSIISYIFKSMILLRAVDFLCNIMFAFINLPTILIKVYFNHITIILYCMALCLSVINENKWIMYCALLFVILI
jgi:ComEC/Rec2-related protein